VRLWDAATGSLLRTLTGHSHDVRIVAFAPDGKTLASGSADSALGSADSTVKLWDAETGRLQHTLVHKSSVRSIAFSPDGKTLATERNVGEGFFDVELWDVETGSFRRTLIHGTFPHKDGAQTIAFSADGRTLATGSKDGLKLWDVETGELKCTLTGQNGLLRSIAFSPLSAGTGKVGNGRCAVPLASATEGGAVTIWDAETGNIMHTLKGHDGDVQSVIFSPDGQTLVTGGLDGTVRLWNAATGNLQRTLTGHQSDVESLAFSPDGKTIASGSWDATIKLWNAQSGRLLATLTTIPLAESTSQRVNEPMNPLTHEPMNPLTRSSGGKPIEIRAKDVRADNYLVLTPEGYYAGSAEADRFVRFRLGNDLFSAECFQARYYRPDLVRQSLAGRTLPPIGEFKGAYPPLVTFTSPRDGEKLSSDSVTVTLQTSDDSNVTHIACFVNGARVDATPLEVSKPIEIRAKPIEIRAKTLGMKDERLGMRDHLHKVSRQFTVAIPLPFNDPVVKLQAIAFDNDRLQSPRAEITITRAPTSLAKGKLLGLCVGVSRHVDTRLNLNYADSDATALADALNKQGLAPIPNPQPLTPHLYSSARVTALTNEQATRENVKAALDQLIAQTTRADTVIVFLSGHGWRDDAWRFYFATHEVVRSNVANSALAWNDVVVRLTELSERSKRVLVLLDACHSGSAATNEQLVKAVLSANAGVIVFASSRGSELSQESDKLQHGVFTQAILEALNGQAAPTGKTHTPLRKFIDYVQDRVAALSNDTQHPQVPFQQDFDTDAPIVVKS
jgi:hypothetical protein